MSGAFYHVVFFPFYGVISHEPESFLIRGFLSDVCNYESALMFHRASGKRGACGGRFNSSVIVLLLVLLYVGDYSNKRKDELSWLNGVI